MENTNINQDKKYNYPDGTRFKLDPNGNKIPIDEKKSLNKNIKERLAPIIGGSPLGDFIYSNTGYGYNFNQGESIDSSDSDNSAKLDTIKSLFKNVNIRPNSSVDSPFLANNYIKGISSTYNDSTYNISTIELIEWTKKVNNAIELDDLDFIFLKNLGVYTNNRLIIARRFPFGIYDDLTNNANKDTKPIAKLISWVKDGDNFIDINFSEKWTESEASFVEILNGIGKDLTTNISKMDNPTEWGSALAAGGGLVPLAGFTEVFQYNVLNKLAKTNLSTVDFTSLPQGNPNLIRQSKRRDVPRSSSDAFSGLIGKFSVKMKVEYEQKYVFGIDPAFAYYSIIANALSFGTSVSSFNFTGELGARLKKFTNDISSGDSSRLIGALVDFVSAIVSALQDMASQLVNAVEGIAKGKISLTDVGTQILKTITKGIGSIINKYKVKIIGVINSLTGTPSGPWHITIGNPKRPIFSSGDMIAEKVTLTLGNVLAFNDLPSSMTLEVEFMSARNLGGQEIFQKLNCGKERSYVVAKGYENGIDFLSSNNEQISKAIDVKIDEMTKSNAAREINDLKNSNTNESKLKIIISDIKSKIVNLGLVYKEGTISAVDEGNAVQNWVKDYKKGDTIDGHIKYISINGNNVDNSPSYYFKK